jgi:hypothetical protein
MQHAPTNITVASRLALVMVVACVAAVCVLGGFEDAAINLEGVQEHGASDTHAECLKIQSQLSDEHTRFWQEARQTVMSKFGVGVANTIRNDFTAKMDENDKNLHQHACQSETSLKPDEDPACPDLRAQRSSIAKAVQDQVSQLLAKDADFSTKRKHLHRTSQDYETRLVNMGCGAALQQTGGVVKEMPAPAGKLSKAEHASQNRLERITKQIDSHKSKVQHQKQEIAAEEKDMARELAQGKDAVQQHQATIAREQEDISGLHKKIKLVKWAQNQRSALLHEKPIPPHTAAKYSGNTPPAAADELDQSIGDMFDAGFHATAPTESLVQVVDADPQAKVALKDFKEAVNSKQQGNPAIRIPKDVKKLATEVAKGNPQAKAAVATADAVEAVNDEVRQAARSAAQVAAREALDKGMDAKATTLYVKKAANKAAKKAARRSRAVFADALKKEPTPQMIAAKRVKIAKKELARKDEEAKKRTAERKVKDKETTALMKKGLAANPDLQSAAKTAVKALSNTPRNGTTPGAGAHTPAEIAAAKAQVANAELHAVEAEADAWHHAVGGAESVGNVLNAIHAFQKAHPGMSLPEATQKWEEDQVLQKKTRFARHFAKGLTVDPNSKEGKLEALHESDRQKINVEKMVLENAEMQAILAKRNAEKSAKAELRTQESLKRYELAATSASKRMDQQIETATTKENQVQKTAVTSVLAKQASQTLAAKTAANAAKARAKHAEAAKKEALGALTVARKKLQKLSSAAAAGTAMLGIKLKEELKAQQEQVQNKIKQVRKTTALEVQARVTKQQKEKYEEKLRDEKDRLAQVLNNKTLAAEQHASQVVSAAEQAAAGAKALAQKEAAVAEKARASSKEIADEATERARAIKAAAAEQVATMAKQKAAAVKHFQEFTANLKELESEKAAKSEAKILAQQEAADAATEEAARAARFAEQQMTEADLQRSQAAINKVEAGGETLQNAIDTMSTVDTRARGKSAIEGEEKALAEEKANKKAKKEAELAATKEKATKAALSQKEQAEKAATAIKEQATKRVLKEKQDARTKIHDEGYQKGVAHAQEVFQSAQKAQAKAAATEAARAKAEGVEKKAKALLKAAGDVKTPSLSPVQEQAAKLVHEAVNDEDSGDKSSIADKVESANTQLKSFMHETGGVQAEKTAKKTQLGINSAAAATGEIGTAEAKKDVEAAAAQVAGQQADKQIKKAYTNDAKAPVLAATGAEVHFADMQDVLNKAIQDVRKSGDSDGATDDAIKVLEEGPGKKDSE